jgi:hypothetical protein
MAPDISSPPRAARNKCPAICSPPKPARYNRNQSEIALSWWAKKKDKVIALKRRVSHLQEQIGILEEEARQANERIHGLEAALQEQPGGGDQNAEKLLGVANSCGGLQRTEDKGDCALAIGALLVSYLGIIMRKTHPVTWIHVVCEALFSNLIFGVEATSTVLEEVYVNILDPEVAILFGRIKARQLCSFTCCGGTRINRSFRCSIIDQQ